MKHLVTRAPFAHMQLGLLRQLIHRVRQPDGAAPLHAERSRDVYEQYGDRELRNYETGKCRALVEGRLEQIPFKHVRDAYIAPIAAEIEARKGTAERPMRVLEIGCGNGTNLMLLRRRFGHAVELAGIDISPSRIQVGRDYWQEQLDGVELRVTSATNLGHFGDDQFDLSCSVCALEQIPYRLHEVVSEMQRVSRAAVVCVEPIYEYGNPTQRLYNIVNDQCRTLLRDLRSCGFDVEEHGLLPVLHNPLNPVGLVVGRIPG